jgi:hypothetical protein
MTAMLIAASQQNLPSNQKKKVKHQHEKNSIQSDTQQTTRSDKSLKERYEKNQYTRNSFTCQK